MASIYERLFQGRQPAQTERQDGGNFLVDRVDSIKTNEKVGLPGTPQREALLKQLNEPTPEQLALEKLEKPGFLKQLGLGALVGLSKTVVEPAKLVTGGLSWLSDQTTKPGQEIRREAPIKSIDRWLGNYLDELKVNYNTPAENITANIVQFSVGALTGATEARLAVAGAANAGKVITTAQNISGPANYLMAHHSSPQEWTAGLLEMGANVATSGQGAGLVKGFEKIGLKNLGNEVVQQATQQAVKQSVQQAAKNFAGAAAQDLLAANVYNSSENLKENRPFFESWQEASTIGLALPMALRGATAGLEKGLTMARNRQNVAKATRETSRAYVETKLRRNIDSITVDVPARNAKRVASVLDKLVKENQDTILTATPEDLYKARGVKVEWRPIEGNGKYIHASKTMVFDPQKATDQTQWHEIGHYISSSLKERGLDVVDTFRSRWEPLVSDLKYQNQEERFAAAIGKVMTNPEIYERNPELVTLVHTIWGAPLNVNPVHAMNAEALTAASMDSRRSALSQALQERMKMQPAAADEVAKNASDAELKSGKIDVGGVKVSFAEQLKAARTQGVQAESSVSGRTVTVEAPPKPGLFSGQRKQYEAPYREPQYTSKTSSVPEVQQTIESTEATPQFQERLRQQRGGVLSRDQVQKNVDVQTSSLKDVEEQLKVTRPGAITNVEGIEAAKRVVAKKSQDVVDFQKEFEQTGNKEALDKAVQSYNELVVLQANQKGIHTEVGRALNYIQMTLDDARYEEADLVAAAKKLRQVDPSLPALEQEARIQESLSQKVVKGFVDYWYAATLSGVSTMARIVSDNVPTAFVEATTKTMINAILHPQEALLPLMDAVIGTGKAGGEIRAIWSGAREAGHIKSQSKGFAGKTAEFFGKIWDTIDQATLGGAAEVEAGITRRDFLRRGGATSEADTVAVAAREKEMSRLAKRNDPEGTIGAAEQILQNGRQSKNAAVRIVATMVAPFTRTAANTLSMKLDYTPLALVRMAKRGWMKEYANPRQVYEATGKLLIGTTVSTYLVNKVYDAAKGDQEGIFITGSGPTTPEQRKVWQATGAKPYSIKVGDKWVPYLTYAGPMSGTLAMAGEVSDKYHFDNSGETRTDALWAGVLNWSTSELNQSFMVGVRDFLDAFGSGAKLEDYGPNFLGSMASVASPALLRNINDYYAAATGQSFLTEPQTAGQKFAKRAGLYSNPVLSPVAEKIFGKPTYKLDVFGQKVPKDAIYGLNWTGDKGDMVTAELLKHDQSLSIDSKVNGNKLEGEQAMTYYHIFGEIVHDKMTEVIASGYYNSAKPEAKKKILAKAKSDAMADADKRIVTIYPELKSTETAYEKKLRTARERREASRTSRFVRSLADDTEVSDLDY